MKRLIIANALQGVKQRKAGQYPQGLTKREAERKPRLETIHLKLIRKLL